MFTICILTKNSERSLAATLVSLKRFPEVLLLDTGSTDRTLTIASQFPNVVIHEAPFTGFGELRNKAAALASHDWILALDSDEILSPLLQEELQALTPLPERIYEIEFRNYYNGKRILGCGWHPESHIRLYHRRRTHFSETAVHEGVITNKLNIQRLRHPIDHTPYRSISDFLAKMQLYSDLFAKEHRGVRQASFSTALVHAIAAFFKSYFLQRGLFLGAEGFIISSYNAATAFYKYLKLREANRS